MKTLQLSKLIFTGTVLAFGTGLGLPHLNAGPGSEYWRNLGRKNPAPAANATAAPTQREPVACTDSHSITVTETKPDLANGRGSVRTVAIGTKNVCTSCSQPTVFMKPSWSNGRGPVQPVEVRDTHDCSLGCGMAKK